MKKIIIGLTFLGTFVGLATNSFAGYFNNAPISTCNVEITRNLSFGSSDSEVSILQEMLYNGGYLSTTPNGYFGYATQFAVKNFQKDNGISATGSVGPATRNAINERLCDSDVRGDSMSYNNYDSISNYNNSGVTYVNTQDPYVRVVSPQNNQNPIVYTNPQNGNGNSYQSNYISTSDNFDYLNSNNTPTITPATSGTRVTNANVVYNAYSGYTYGIIPAPGSVTITSPLVNSVYNEGDTVNLNWTTNNFHASQFQVSVENSSTGVSRVVTVVSGNSASFVLTKDALDYICSGNCVGYGRDSYKIVLSTPYSDIAGNVSTFKAVVAPISIVRPYSYAGNVSLSAGKSPVDSGEKFKLYVNILNANTYSYNYWNNGQNIPYSFGISTVCSSGVSVSIGGLNCGQEFAMPQMNNYTQKEIPVTAINNGWFAQAIIFNLTAYNQAGQIIGTASTTVQVNPIARGW